MHPPAIGLARRSLLVLAAVSIGSLGVPGLALAADKPPPLAEALKTMDELYRADSSVGRLELIVKKGKKTRTMRMKMWTKGLEKSLVVVEAPARDKGTATLKSDKNLWNYLPKISRTVRIPPSMMLNSWMGSDFTNDDLVREASYQEDFDAAWAGRPKSGKGWLLRLDAKPGKVGLWKRIDVILNESGTLPERAYYYDRKFRLARTLYFEEVKKLGGRTIPTRMRLVPTDKPDQSTEMHYLDIQFNAHVPDSTFSLSRLQRGR